MQTVLQDIRYAYRKLVTRPGFTTVAVLTLALGIGATTTLFSVLNGLLLKPLPVHEPDRLVFLTEVDAQGDDGYRIFSYPHYLQYREGDIGLSGLAAYGHETFAVNPGSAPEVVQGTYVTGNYFNVLGLQPAAGRFFAVAEDPAPGSHPEAVISHTYWQQRFGADPSVIGRTIRVNNKTLAIVGVAPEGFRGILQFRANGMWVPMSMFPLLHPKSGNLYTFGRKIWLETVGRLRAGVTREQAVDAATALVSNLEHNHVRDGVTIQGARLPPPTLMAMASGPPVLGIAGLLLVPALLVLLIAAANVGGMLLARTTVRGRELAIRRAVGAGRARVVRQLLTETALLFVLGGVGAILISVWLTDLIMAYQPPTAGRVVLDFDVDARVLTFAFTISVLTGLFFGLAPALRGSRMDVVDTIKESAQGLARNSSRLRGAFVVGQVALTILLLTAAGLFLRSLRQSIAVDPGFESAGVTVASLDLEPHGYAGIEGRQFYDRLLRRVRALPGVASAELASQVPLDGRTYMTGVHVGDHQNPSTPFNIVTPGYLRLLRVPLTAGRAFSDADRPGAPTVAIINRAMAREFWPNATALGQSFFRGSTELRVVGIIANVKFGTIRSDPESHFYLPFSQNYDSDMVLHMRAANESAAVLPAVRRVLGEMDPDIPLRFAGSMDELTGAMVSLERVLVVLLGGLGSLGLILAAVGLYGMVAYAAARRTREIGIRRALGAHTGEVVRLVLRRGIRLAALGSIIGLLLTLAVTRILSGVLYGVSPTDPLTFGIVIVILAGVALLASYIPAHRATRVDPMEALRYE